MSTIKEANQDFRSENFHGALKKYNELVVKIPHFENIINLNIEQCKKKLNESELSEKNSEIDSVEAIKIILEQPISTTPVNYEYYLTAIDQIKNRTIKSETILAALKCLQSSPFQSSLLKSIYAIIKELDLFDLLAPHSSKPSLSLGGLIVLANDKDYWATYKYIFEQYINNVGLSCENSFNLLCTDPKGKVRSRFKYSNNKKNISFGTILLNEQKFIGSNLCQHYDLCDEWILVEGACKGYPERKVSKSGLSLDNTELIINLFPDPLAKITYIQYGWTKATGEDAKSELRNEYAKRISGEYLVVIDADEFYQKNDLNIAIETLKNDKKKFAIVLPQVHFWKTTNAFITGEYYDISHTRIYRIIPGMKYVKNHNFPEINGKFVHQMGQFKYPRKVIEIEKYSGAYNYDGPKCFHMGFAKDFEDMKDKTEYYVNRGEDKTRILTTNSRAAWFNGHLPEKCRVRDWGGEIPTYIKAMGVSK